MTSIKTISQADKLLARYVPLAKEVTGKNITLERMEKLMTVLGNPQDTLKIVHIAGTSGKTSTAYFISRLLTVNGMKTGLTVSPHVDSVMERIQVNSQILGEKEFTSSLSEFITLITNSEIEPTYFELLVAYAYWYFAKIGVDYAVVETGMGGLQDGTNVANSPDKLCVITDIGLDHMHVLGNTVTQIARQKAGIIHANNTALMYRQTDEIMDIINERCDSVKAHLQTYEENALGADEAVPPEIGVLPGFQRRNWLLAYETYKFIAERDGLAQLTPDKMVAAMQTQVPGRMEQVTVNGKIIIMDGAHNEQKTGSFVSSFIQKHPGKKVPVLLSLKEGKEFSAVLPLLKPIASYLIITTFKSSQDLPAESIDPNELATAAKKFGIQNIIIQPDQNQAYQELINQPGDLAIITGSFYLIGQLRNGNPELRNA